MAPISHQESERRKKRLISHGYALVDDSANVDLVPLLRRGIETLHENGLPASFIFLFDETWQLAQESKRTLETVSDYRNSFNFDLLAWYIPPGKGGFSPHRDRQPDHAASTFHPIDQQAMFITQWIALSEATAENSCLYVIPKPSDPGYMDGDTEDTGDPLRRALPTKESYQNIHALPRDPGQSVLFTHRIIHWGSRGCTTDDADSSDSAAGSKVPPPRIAISFVCSDPSFEAPLLVNHATYFSSHQPRPTLPPFRIRLLLVCAQLLIYYQRFDLGRHVIKACYDYCKTYQDELEENYRKRVFVEFVKAMKEAKDEIMIESSIDVPKQVKDGEAAAEGELKHTTSREGDCDEDDEEDEEDDALLDAMLDAEEEGYGEFQDDYDELEDELHEEEEAEKIDNEDSEEEREASEDEETDDEDETAAVNIFGKRRQDISHDDELPVKRIKPAS